MHRASFAAVGSSTSLRQFSYLPRKNRGFAAATCAFERSRGFFQRRGIIARFAQGEDDLGPYCLRKTLDFGYSGLQRLELCSRLRL